MTNQPQNNDQYREIIEDEDLGEKSFSGFTEEIKEEPVNIVEEVEQEEVIPTNDTNLNSIRESAFKVEVPEEKPIIEKVIPPISDFTIDEDLTGEPVLEEVPEEQVVKSTPEAPAEIKQPTIEVSVEIPQPTSETKVEVVEPTPETPVEPIISEPTIVEAPQPTPEVKVEPIIEKVEVPKPEPAPVTYKEVRDVLYTKVSPKNEERFSLLGLEATSENKRLLDDIAIKINFLDDDFEDGAISEKEAILKIEELQKLLSK
ncbi:MAG: hypothetical protein PHG24_01155 [Candidatus Pacebacteria bacterium]|nr:hypothetical protein [Candidatus Paceibacterota bacterium]